MVRFAVVCACVCIACVHICERANMWINPLEYTNYVITDKANVLLENAHFYLLYSFVLFWWCIHRIKIYERKTKILDTADTVVELFAVVVGWNEYKHQIAYVISIESEHNIKAAMKKPLTSSKVVGWSKENKIRHSRARESVAILWLICYSYFRFSKIVESPRCDRDAIFIISEISVYVSACMCACVCAYKIVTVCRKFDRVAVAFFSCSSSWFCAFFSSSRFLLSV